MPPIVAIPQPADVMDLPNRPNAMLLYQRWKGRAPDKLTERQTAFLFSMQQVVNAAENDLTSVERHLLGVIATTMAESCWWEVCGQQQRRLAEMMRATPIESWGTELTKIREDW